jgi:hypothetical protein
MAQLREDLARQEELWHGGGHHVRLDDVLDKEAVHLLARARYNTFKATETVTVSDGPTVHRQITLVD